MSIRDRARRARRRSGSASRGRRSGTDGEEAPRAGHALQLALAAVIEPELGAGEQVGHGARHQDLARPGLLRDTRGDVYRQSAEVASAQLAFARVQARADVDAE